MIREIAADLEQYRDHQLRQDADASAADQPSPGRALRSERDRCRRSIHEPTRQLATQSLSPCRRRGDYVRHRARLAKQAVGDKRVLRGWREMAYRYEDSGLDNIYLDNGYTIHETPYGQGVSIEDTAGLHKAIGLWLVSLPKPLNGAELRFLRLELEMTQRHLAATLGTTEQSLRLWEKNRKKRLGGPADRLLRALYSEYVGGDGSIRRMVDRLAQLDQIERAEARLCETDNGWEVNLTEAA